MKLSVALAVHNEEHNIPRCIGAIYDWVDEIVVIDGESADNTVSILKKLDKDKKIKIFSEKNPSMFHINKQKALEQCKGEWILQLDADEIVSDDLRKEILKIVDHNSQDQAIAFWIPRLNYFLGRPLRKGGQYPDYTIRLYKNDVAHFPCKDVHEQVEIKNVSNLDTQISKLNSNLLHYPYPTFKDYLDKTLRYSYLEADMLYDQKTPINIKTFLLYMIIKPKWWFLKTYFRHKGFVDGFPGFVFSFISALRFCFTYIRLYELNKEKQ